MSAGSAIEDIEYSWDEPLPDDYLAEASAALAEPEAERAPRSLATLRRWVRRAATISPARALELRIVHRRRKFARGPRGAETRRRPAGPRSARAVRRATKGKALARAPDADPPPSIARLVACSRPTKYTATAILLASVIEARDALRPVGGKNVGATS
jgi:hypothetical protein